MVRIPNGKGIGGPAKGEGSKKPRGAAFTSDNAREMQLKAAAKMRENIEARKAEMAQWHSLHPEYGGAALSPKQQRDYIATGLPPVIDVVIADAKDREYGGRHHAQKLLFDKVIPNVPQAIELSGPDGKPLEISAVDPVEAARQYQEIMKGG